MTGWKLNRINCGPPYRVECIKYGPEYGSVSVRESPPQVVDARGTVALSGPGGAVFCWTLEQAEDLCRQANHGELERV
jgi:hypothetical protein